MQKIAVRDRIIAVAGANGDLGGRIIAELVRLGATPRALVRAGSTASFPGADTVPVDYNNPASLRAALRGVHCVVSALSGLRAVIVDAQTALLTAAVDAGVPRAIPSDFSIDYTRLPEGSNRNLDLRREFARRIDAAPIRATSVLNGMFSDMLLKEAPLVQAGLKRVLYWGNADQPLDFTTINNTAAFTARAALDEDTPRYLRIAGDVVSSRELAAAASRATGHQFKPTRVGGLGFLKGMITITKTLMPQPKEVFPPWQGMQYLHNMYTGLPKFHALDNDRYPDMQWTSVTEVLKGLKVT
ncbi:aromatic alcohol reductase [Paracnuella aquatica]|uniref:aromatic alcohol reductase n=1 Tax=Paracnuella aquatica TaxID=2268757 RepID=UPI000DEEBEE7|nr:aromatic alcohol reductase [Paracnuella aquatica]RPD45964.1 aromatic alcohol reductase [Paracnuella aquatica]